MTNYKQELYDYINGLGDDIQELEQQVRIAFSSVSHHTGKMCRLVWIEKTDKTEDFWVWIRKEIKGKEYPDKNVSKYTPDGGYCYPAFKIITEEDLSTVKELIKYAYDNM